MQMLHLAHPDKARTAGGCGLPSNLLTCAWINRTSSCDRRCSSECLEPHSRIEYATF